MPRPARPPKGILAERLDRLFRMVHPKDRGPYTAGEVADAINTAAGDRVISATYLYLLRTGQRDNPTLRHLTALARFFGVPPVYFLPGDSTQEQELPPEVVAALTDDAAIDDVTPMMAAFLDRQGGADKLAAAFASKPPTADGARLALRATYALGRSDESLVGALSKAAGLEAKTTELIRRRSR